MGDFADRGFALGVADGWDDHRKGSEQANDCNPPLFGGTEEPIGEARFRQVQEIS